MRFTLCLLFALGCASPVFADTLSESLQNDVATCKTAITRWRTDAGITAMLAGSPNNGPRSDLLADSGRCRISSQFSAALGASPEEAGNAGKQILALLEADPTLKPNSMSLIETAKIIIAWPNATAPLPKRRALGVYQESNEYKIGSVGSVERAFKTEPASGANNRGEYTTDEALSLLPLAIYSDAFDEVRTRSIANASLAEVAARAAASDGKWRSYHFGGGDTRVQLPWELVLNDAWLRGRSTTVNYLRCLEDSRKSDVDGKPCEPLQAPTTSWTLLHPSVGITPFDSKGNSSGVTGVIEVFGWNRWEYDQSTFARKNDWSVSIVGVYAPADDRKDWSPGLLLRTPYSGLSFVWSQPQLRGGGTSNAISLSVDISKVVSSELNENSLMKSLTSIFGGR
jgi:hypothetical protein